MDWVSGKGVAQNVYFCYARKRAVCGGFCRFSDSHYLNKDVFNSGYNSTITITTTTQQQQQHQHRKPLMMHFSLCLANISTFAEVMWASERVNECEQYKRSVFKFVLHTPHSPSTPFPSFLFFLILLNFYPFPLLLFSIFAKLQKYPIFIALYFTIQ